MESVSCTGCGKMNPIFACLGISKGRSQFVWASPVLPLMLARSVPRMSWLGCSSSSGESRLLSLGIDSRN
jgi:hypothetical protein